MKFKRYLVFVFHYPYPEGGWNDFSGSFDNYEAAHSYAQAKIGTGEWADAHIVDTKVGDKFTVSPVTVDN